MSRAPLSAMVALAVACGSARPPPAQVWPAQVSGRASNGGFVCGRVGGLVPGCRAPIPIYSDVTSPLSLELIALYLRSHPRSLVDADR